jgi:cell division protein FtsB
MRRIFPLLVVIFVAASVLIFCFGDSGLLAYRDLEKYKKELAANVAALEERNHKLDAELESERTSQERTAVLARSIGLYRPGDKVVRLEGRQPRAELYAVGDYLKMSKKDESRSAVLKAIAAAVAAFVVAFAFVASRAGRRKPHGSPG